MAHLAGTLARLLAVSACAVAPPAFAQCARQWLPNLGTVRPSVLRPLANGDVLAAGGFTSFEGVPANRIHQFVQAGRGALGGLMTLSSSNRLTVTIGVF
jgi:hypothetical protein